MCGICGWIDNSKIDEGIITSMTRELQHRGPDLQKTEVFENAALGHARLSIIDLSDRASQPMHNEDKTIWLVYNGEFYNFQEFRSELIRKGHRFISRTDSEVLLHLYEEYGADFVSKVRGMFAFGIFDQKNNQLMLARDRVGIKPLYYYHENNTFLFASELKALLKYPHIDRQIDAEALKYYFTFGYIPRHHCIFTSIKKLLPGHYLIYKDGQVNIRPFWNLPGKESMSDGNETEYAESLLHLLHESVKLRMIADVPLGVFLSGGVDSSIVAAIMSRNSTKPIKTFSIGFEEVKYNELPYARQVARHIGSQHHEFIVCLNETEILDKLMYFYDEPFADSSVIPTYYVSKMAREHVKVVLSGDGGDELFGGYNWYDWVLKRSRFQFLPYSLRKALSSLSQIPPFDYRGKEFFHDLYLDEYDLFYKRTCFFTESELAKLLKIDARMDLNSHRAFYENSGETTLERMTQTDFSYYLPDDILTKVDRASMAVSLEARVPILDHKLCEFAFSLPPEVKIRHGVKKHLLKKIAKKLLPEGFVLERKQGFSIPLKEWMEGDLGNKVLEVISGKTTRDIIDTRYVHQLLQLHRTQNSNQNQKLWAVLAFGLWANAYLS